MDLTMISGDGGITIMVSIRLIETHSLSARDLGYIQTDSVL